MRTVALVATVTLVLDQLTKVAVVWWLGLAQRGVIEVLPPYLTFRMAWNAGVNFGLLSSNIELMRWVLIAVALGISAWVWHWIARPGTRRVTRIAAGLLIGGAIGNVIDRILYGAVADFLNMSCCGFENPYAFNVADIAIFAGAIGLVLFASDPKGPGVSKAAAKRRGRKTP